MKQILLVFALLFLVLCGCGKGSDPTRSPNDFVPVTSIRIVATSSKIAAKTSTRLTVLGSHSGVYESDLTSQAVWVSNTQAVADFVTVSQSNRISGIVPGNVVISATAAGMTTTLPLTVSTAKISTVTVSTLTPSVASGLTSQFTARGLFDDSSTQDISFDAIWSVDTSGFASISNDVASRGLAKGLAKGIASITAVFDNVPGSAQLSVVDPILQSLTIIPANQSVDIFSTPSFGATGVYSDNTNVPVSTGLSWSSSNQNVATIAADTGVVTLTGIGTSSIGVSSGGITATPTNLTVKDFNLSFSVSKSPIIVAEKVNFKVTATTVGGTTGQDVTANCGWQSNSIGIATVGNTSADKGLVTAVSIGQTTITAAYGGKSLTFTVTVN
jgi:hypothetical protein